MSAGFYFDDKPNLLHPDAVRWVDLSIESVRRTLTEVTLTSRPVANISFAVNHLFSEFEAAPYHWTNLVIHLAVGLALFWVIRLFQRYHVKEKGGEWLALLAVLLFLVHPLNIQAVTYVVQRMTSMATLFFLLGVGSYIVGRFHIIPSRRLAWFALTALSLVLSIGSKEIGYLLLPLLLLYEVCFHRAEWRTWYLTSMSASARPAMLSAAGIAVLLLALFAWYLLDGRIYWLESMPNRDFSGIERVLTQGRVQFFYLSLLFWPSPSRLNIDHDFLISRGLFDPATTALALVGCLLLLVFALRNLSSRPQLAFPLLAYLLLHSMESAPISLELVFEHRMYLPMTMLALLIPLNLGSLVKQHGRALHAALFMMSLILAAATYQRNQVWGDPVTFFRDTAIKSPNKFRPQYNLGTNLGPMGLLQEAKTALEKAAELKPDHSEVNNQLANVYLLEDRPDAAERHYRLAVQNDPKNAEALFNFAGLLRSQQRFEEQKVVLEQFILHAPPYLEQQKQWAIEYLKVYDRSQP
jgi:tetratricopeptide (TPR) repeat protein